MADTAFFKTTTFGGFDKKSVLTYIDSLNEGFHKTEQQYQEKLNAFAQAQESQIAHIKNLEAQLADQNGKLEAVALQLEEERRQAAAAQEMLKTLQTQNEELQEELNASEREVKIQTERSRQLQFKAESLDYKSKKYDELSNQIGDTIIEAKRDAERIVAEANAQAKQSVDQANAQAKQITDQAKDYMKNFYAELASFNGDAGRLRKSIEEILFVLNDRVDVMQEVIRQIEDRFNPQEGGLSYIEEPGQPFAEPDDEAGHVGGVTREDLSD